MLFSAPPSGAAVVSARSVPGRPLSQMTAAELKILAKKLGIGGCDSMTKKQLISAIGAVEDNLAELIPEDGADGASPPERTPEAETNAGAKS